jgi:hypothetical protein
MITPNTCTSSFMLMYSDGSLLPFRSRPGKNWRRSPTTTSAASGPAGYTSMVDTRCWGFHPLDQRGLAVANGPPDPDIGRPVGAHARFGQPRGADFQACCRFLRSKKNNAGRPKLLGRGVRILSHARHLQLLRTKGTFDHPRDRYLSEFLTLPMPRRPGMEEIV